MAVILHADVVGSTTLVRRDEGLAHERIQDSFLRLANTIEAYGGSAHELRGDAVVAEFQRASDALAAAIVFQSENKEFVDGLEDEIQPSLRIGIAMGEVVIADNTITGEGVVLAQRLEQLAEAGGICIQGAAYETVPKRLPFEYRNLGERVLKGFEEPVRAYTATLKTGESVPPPEVVAWTDEPAPRQPEKPSIAVLPFRSLGGDSEQDYLVDGIRLAIQASLVKVSGLFLIGPAAVSNYRQELVTADQVAHDLGVRYILEGAVQQSQGRIRITVQLTDGAERRIVWAERYDRELADTLAVQDEITTEVLKALDIILVSGEQTEVLRGTLTNLDALHAFYRGLNHWYARTKDDNVVARRMFEDVVRLQPESPVGASYMCMTHWIDALMGWSESKEHSLQEAAQWAQKALALDDKSGLPHIVLASAHLLNHRHDEALATCYEAVKLRTSCPAANSYLATVFHYCGR
ncbi:MAG: adenylate/guanylate cyclase domain-containing protein, partial [Gammaproteobacteria bacterium]|nr:adenylate/guanylate cyclase domain-containing protein [Gammaproteobacteria bacterium]